MAAISFGAERINWIRYEVETRLWSLELGIWVLLPFKYHVRKLLSFWGQVPSSRFPGSQVQGRPLSKLVFPGTLRAVELGNLGTWELGNLEFAPL